MHGESAKLEFEGAEACEVGGDAAGVLEMAEPTTGGRDSGSQWALWAPAGERMAGPDGQDDVGTERRGGGRVGAEADADSAPPRDRFSSNVGATRAVV